MHLHAANGSPEATWIKIYFSVFIAEGVATAYEELNLVGSLRFIHTAQNSAHFSPVIRVCKRPIMDIVLDSPRTGKEVFRIIFHFLSQFFIPHTFADYDVLNFCSRFYFIL